MKTKLLTLTLFFVVAFLATAQNIDRNDIKFEYAQLPARPLDKSLKSYQTKSIMMYASDVSNQKLSQEERLKKADADYAEDVKNYEIKKKESQARYDAQMVEWNKKKLAERIILKDKEPKMENVPMPHKERPAEEKTQKLFDEALVASFVKLDGFKNSPDNAIKITIKLLGFESTGPTAMSREQNEYKGGNTTKVTIYWNEIQYKHPMGYKVELPNGQVIIEDYPAEMVEFSVYKTAETKGSGSSIPASTLDALIQRLQNEIVEKNLKRVNEIINNDYGYRKMTRETELIMVSSKDNEYPEYKDAYDNATEGYKGMSQSAIMDASIAKIKKAVDIWEKDMTESKPNDKKARIDADVTIATLFNLIEAEVWIGDYAKVDENMSKLNRLDLSKKERKRYEALSPFVAEQRVRYEANK